MKSLCNTCRLCDKENMMCSKYECSKIDNEVRICQHYKPEEGK